MRADAVRTASIRELQQLFGTLGVPPTPPSGLYRAEFIGPTWLRLSGRPGVSLAGLPRWLGKRFLGPDSATNVLAGKDGNTEKLHMHCATVSSSIDGRPSLVLTYGPRAPRPWRWVRDELRYIDDRMLLGMTVIEQPLLRRLPLPFLLVRDS